MSSSSGLKLFSMKNLEKPASLTNSYTISEEYDLYLQESFKGIFSTLAEYLGLRWVAMIDTKSKSFVCSYPENIHALDLLESISSVDHALEKNEKSRNESTCLFFRKDSKNLLVYSTVDNRYALIANLPPDIPLNPAERICEHTGFVLRQFLNTVEDSNH